MNRTKCKSCWKLNISNILCSIFFKILQVWFFFSFRILKIINTIFCLVAYQNTSLTQCIQFCFIWKKPFLSTVNIILKNIKLHFILIEFFLIRFYIYSSAYINVIWKSAESQIWDLFIMFFVNAKIKMGF